MAEQTVVELFLKIERLENELKAAQRINLKVADLEAAVIQKDKEIAQYVNTEKKLEQTVANLQQLVMNYKQALDNQNNDIASQTAELNNLKRILKNTQDSYQNACAQNKELLENLKNEKDLLITIKSLKEEISKYRNFLQKIVQPLTSLSEFNKDVLQAINSLLNQVSYN